MWCAKLLVCDNMYSQENKETKPFDWLLKHVRETHPTFHSYSLAWPENVFLVSSVKPRAGLKVIGILGLTKVWLTPSGTYCLTKERSLIGWDYISGTR